MNKNDMIEAMATASDISKAAAERALNTVVESIVSTLSGKGEVAIPGLGKFETSVRSARTGRNPLTGEPMNIPETVVPKFKASKRLKDAVKGVKDTVKG